MGISKTREIKPQWRTNHPFKKFKLFKTNPGLSNGLNDLNSLNDLNLRAKRDQAATRSPRHHRFVGQQFSLLVLDRPG
jgi:hypothetical protein